MIFDNLSNFSASDGEPVEGAGAPVARKKEL